MLTKLRRMDKLRISTERKCKNESELKSTTE